MQQKIIFSYKKTKKISKLHVKFSPLSIDKNNKPDREKIHEYFANRIFDFNRTKKFGISTKNYTREEPKINNLDQGRNIGIRQEYMTNKENKRVQPKKQKKHYINRNDNIKQESQ
jgi:hypothetical protein